MDFSIIVETASGKPIYKQIYDQLRSKILEGFLPPYTKLPSAKDLSEIIGVARGTVVKAYSDLSAEGLIETIIGSGTYISSQKVEAVMAQPDIFKDVDTTAFSIYANSILNTKHSRTASSATNKALYGAASSDMLSESKWKQVMAEQIHLFSAHDEIAKSASEGDLPCRQALVKFLKSHKGILCSPEQLILFQGTQQPLAFISRLLVNSGDAVAIESPSYSGARADFSFCGADLMPIDTDDDGLKVESVINSGKKIKALYCTPSYGDPTGVVMSLDRRKALLEWAKTTNTILIEDEFESHFCYVPPVLPSLKALDAKADTFYIFSFWKLFYPLNSLSLLVVPNNFVELFKQAKNMSDISCSRLETASLGSFIEKGYMGKHIKKCKTVYIKRRKSAIEKLLSYFSKNIFIPKQSAAYHLCVRFSETFNKSQLEDAAYKAGLPMISTSNYYLQNPRANEFLIPFATQDQKKLEAQIARFASNLS